MSVKLKRDILKLLEKDAEFRVALAGLISLEEFRKTSTRLEETISSLAQAQKRTEEELKELVNGLNRLEKIIEELSLTQRRTEEKLGELASAQKMTEEALRGLAVQIGRLTDTLGFGLEDVARIVVPSWLYKHEGIIVEELHRKILIMNGEEVEINLYGEGLKDGEKIVILGEVKSRIYKADVEEFISKLEKIEKTINLEKYKLIFGYYVHPSAEKIAEENKIKLIASYMR